jgi:FkbM family methyltransferase
MHKDMIFDIGMYNAADTEFYLQKGFRVVAVEANPALCAEGASRLASYISDKRLTILNRGISDTSGINIFYINLDRSDRSSFLAKWCALDRKAVIKVDCVRLDEILEAYGTPYYLKVDIEHLDHVCIDALERRRQLPAYVSMETKQVSFVHRMSALGYSRFKVVSQVWNQAIRLPCPPLEGLYVDERFTAFHSGPFGNETYGDWFTKEQALDEIEKVRGKNYLGSRHRLMGCPEEIFFSSWYDVHAARDLVDC